MLAKGHIKSIVWTQQQYQWDPVLEQLTLKFNLTHFLLLALEMLLQSKYVHHLDTIQNM